MHSDSSIGLDNAWHLVLIEGCSVTIAKAGLFCRKKQRGQSHPWYIGHASTAGRSHEKKLHGTLYRTYI